MMKKNSFQQCLSRLELDFHLKMFNLGILIISIIMNIILKEKENEKK